jgi:hypothetical protein
VPINLWGEIDDLLVYIDYVEGRSDVRVTSASAGRLTATVTPSSCSFVGADKMAVAELCFTHRRYRVNSAAVSYSGVPDSYLSPDPDNPDSGFSLFSSVPLPHTDTMMLTSNYSMVISICTHYSVEYNARR